MVISWLRQRITSRFITLFALACIGLFAVGCGKPYQIVKQANPNPFLGKKEFVVLPIDYADLHVGEKTESEYVNGKGEDSAASFQGDKEGINEKFIEALRAHSADNGIVVDPAAGVVKTFLIKPHIRFIEPGFFTAIVNGPSKVEMSVVITDEHGTELDEILVQHGTNSGMFNPSSGQRLRSDGEALGGFVAVYLNDRTLGEK